MIPPNLSAQPPIHLEEGWAEYVSISPAYLFKGWGKLLLL